MIQLRYGLFILICLSAMLVSSCKKNITVPPFPFSTPLQALINSDTSLSMFYAAVQKSGDTALYGGTDSITVLIPTNAAFTSQGITASTINAMSAASTDSLLRYHFIPRLDSLVTGVYTAYTSKSGLPVYGYTDSTGNYFNGIQGIRQTLRGSNATVYELVLPLQVPAVNITQLIASDTSLTYFAEAVKYTGLTVIPVNGWNTILAPNNAAFIAAGYPTIASIDNADPATLTNILLYHILPGQYFSNSFTGLSAVASLQGNNINLSVNIGPVQLTGNSNTSAAAIITANRIAGSNIILHTINGVLLP